MEGSTTWAREFRYDSPRQRYLTRELDPSSLTAASDHWTDYVGDSPIADYEVNSQIPTDQRRYMAGVAETDVSGTTPATVYLHGDLIGSTTAATDDPATGAATVVRRRVYTAFGELVEMTGNRVTRYGYAGAWGYQEHDTDGVGGSGDGEADNILMASPTDGFPFLHLGARYYDPALGRFLQRDPIGIAGGMNVYAYVTNQPVTRIDPSGFVPNPADPLGFPGRRTPPRGGGENPITKGRRIAEEVGAKAPNDKWAHCVVSCRLVSEVPGGFLGCLPVGLLKELGDIWDDPSVGLDSFGDMLANSLGFIHGPGVAIAGGSCENECSKVFP